MIRIRGSVTRLADEIAYHASRLIERVMRARDHIWSWRRRPCWQCGRRTRWVEVCFETHIHRGLCTRKADKEYFESLAAQPGARRGRRTQPGAAPAAAEATQSGARGDVANRLADPCSREVSRCAVVEAVSPDV